MTMADTRLEITTLDIRNFKRIEDAKLDTGADRYLLLLAGEETQGKTSVLDAVRCALGGGDETPADPVKHGADKAEIVVELNDGLYRINLTVGADRKRKLVITGPDGTIGAPQTWLDRLFEGKFLDPGKFLRETDAEQVRSLLKVIGVDVEGLDLERKRTYDTRTEAGRRLKDARGALEAVPKPPEEPPAARPILKVNAELADLDAKGNALVRAEKRLLETQTEVDASLVRIAGLEAQIQIARAALVTQIKQRDEAAVAAPSPGEIDTLRGRRTELLAELGLTEQRARWEATAAVLRRQRDEASNKVKSLEEVVDNTTKAIESIDAAKRSLLAEAKMPVEGLALTDAGLTLDGVPFSQASYAQRLRTALAVSLHQSPKFRDVLMRVGGNDFSEKGLEAVRQIAKEADCRIWIEQVGEDRGPSAIVIRDGTVVKRPAGAKK